jgi:predicted site-specific integrase-resolvase
MNHVTVRTVWNWIRDKKVMIKKTESGRNLIVTDSEKIDSKIVIYARVSSSENTDNLERQKQRLLDYSCAKGYKIDSVITEIGSGLNDKRPKLEKILLDKKVTKIIVENKDRFARFGLNYIEKLLEIDGRKLEIVNPVNSDRDDLMQDFVSIITSFTARLYGQRKNKRKIEEIIKQLEEENT